MKVNNGTNRILYHDIVAQTISELPYVSVFEENQSYRIVAFLGCSPDVNSS
jgi:hypothetical protein